MKTKSLYISSQEKNAGTLFITMGMMGILKKNIPRVAFFRPIIFSRDIEDGDINFINEYYNLGMDYEECFGFDIEELESKISQNKTNELINTLLDKFKKLEDRYDFVLCEGIRRSFITTTLNFDINILIAQNFDAPVLNIINAKDRSPLDIYENVLIEHENLKREGCFHFATFINRLDAKQYEVVSKKLQNYNQDVYLLP